MSAPRILTDPELRPFIPMLYVAWADGDLTADEVREIKTLVDAEPWLSPEARRELGRFLDPARPPGPSELGELLAAVRETAGTLGQGRRLRLAELGVALAGREVDERVRKALEEIELALGMVGTEASRSLLPPAEPEKAAAAPAPSFDRAAMQRLLDGAYRAERDEARAFLADPDHRAQPGLQTGAYRELVLDWLRELAGRGVGRRAYPGVTSDDPDLGPFMATFETLGHGDTSLLVKLGVQYGLFGGAVYFLGTDVHRRLLPDVASLKLLGCFAMTELGHGSNVMDLETVARWVPEEKLFEIHTPTESARKEWIGNAALHARLAVVFAQLEVGGERHGVHAFLVPVRDAEGKPVAGVRTGDSGHKLGLNGVDNGRLWFDRVRVRREALLDRFASLSEEGVYSSPIPSPTKRFFTMIGTLVAGRICVASGALSAAKVGLAVAVRYAEARRQFGPPGTPEVPLLDYRTHQRRLLPLLASTYAYHFAVDDVRRRFLEKGDDEEKGREVEALAAGVKSLATWHATRTLQICRECCGGQGFASANRIGPLKSDTDVFTTFEGDNTVLMQLVAKSLLTGFKRQFADARMVGTLKYLVERAASEVRERNPIVTRRTDIEHLRDREFQTGALRYREERLLGTVARRLKKRIDAGVDSFQAMIETQDHLVALAAAHVERVVHERFVAVALAEKDKALAAVLDRLCDLYTLHRIEEDAAWFLENGVMEPAKVRALREVVSTLCAEVRPDARALCDAFGIPDACLAAPIAFGDPAHPAV